MDRLLQLDYFFTVVLNVHIANAFL